MVSSLDGFIVKKDRSVSWMLSTDNYDKGIELTKENIAEFLVVLRMDSWATYRQVKIHRHKSGKLNSV